MLKKIFAPSGSSPFNSATISGLKLWLKSDVGVFQVFNTLVPSVNNGDPVGKWRDQSGNVNDLLQPTAGSRPTYRTNAINGRPAIRGDGTDDSLTKSFTLDQPFHVFMVAKLLGITQYDSFFSGAQGTDAVMLLTNDGSIGSGIPTASTSYFMYMDLPGPTKDVFVAPPTYIIECQYNGASSKMSLNNGAYSTGNVGGNTAAGFTLFTDAENAYHQNSDIGEVLVYNRILSAGEIATAQAYLNGRWGAY